MRRMLRAVLVFVCIGIGQQLRRRCGRLRMSQSLSSSEGCDHFQGEIPDPSDKQRMREVNREIRKLCTGKDKKLAQLKRKYANKHRVMHV